MNAWCILDYSRDGLDVIGPFDTADDAYRWMQIDLLDKSRQTLMRVAQMTRRAHAKF